MGKRSIMLGVCHHDDSRTFFVEFRQQIHYFGTIFRVKITCRLIGQNQLGIGDHRTGNSYTLLLATGKLLRKMFARWLMFMRFSISSTIRRRSVALMPK